MWMHGIFGSQGMIWWWILCLASSHLQKSPQETRNVIYLLAPAIQILPASQVYDRYSCTSLLLGSFPQACMHKISSLPTDPPRTSFWTYLIHIDWGAHTYHNQALMNILCFDASETSNTQQDRRYPWQKVLGNHPVSPHFYFLFFLCKRKLSCFPGTD